MASTRRKSAAIALAVVGIAGLSLASAAQLTVNTSTLQAGKVAVGKCDDNGVKVDYTSAFAAGSYNATGLSVTDIAAACDGGTIKVTVIAGGTTREVTGTSISGGTFTPTAAAFGAAIPADAITDVAVVITK
ncbi:hypothetical protein [Actinotalea subterranea]|uniref:hypothetical protein n=1 Tax=Actinotalea subterranea TaxID=2607497 RepID=UPI0011EBEDEA|nr:hypothetical protein [Actinotalea subterranea]